MEYLDKPTNQEFSISPETAIEMLDVLKSAEKSLSERIEFLSENFPNITEGTQSAKYFEMATRTAKDNAELINVLRTFISKQFNDIE
jgi:hypothetical protein